MPRDIEPGYKQSIDDVQGIPIPADRMEDTSPTDGEHKPFAVLGTVADGFSLTGTIIRVNDIATGVVTGDVKNGAIYYHQVQNVRTYAGAVEATWGVLNFGDKVYYDPSSTMPAAAKLSTSPLDKDGVQNTFFGWIVWAQDEVIDPFQGDRDPYPTATATASLETDIAIMQVGAGGGPSL